MSARERDYDQLYVQIIALGNICDPEVYVNLSEDLDHSEEYDYFMHEWPGVLKEWIVGGDDLKGFIKLMLENSLLYRQHHSELLIEYHLNYLRSML